MILMDGQEIQENTENKKTDKIGKIKYIKQFLQKMLIILLKIVIICFLYSICKKHLVEYKSPVLNYGIDDILIDILIDILDIIICIFSTFKNFIYLFKYEEDYDMFKEFERFEGRYNYKKIKKHDHNNDDIIIDKYIEQKSIDLKANNIKIKNEE